MRYLLFVFVVPAISGCAYLDYNLREVAPDEFYRSAQMPRGRLADVIRTHDIATVVNFRGTSDEEWFQDEAAVCKALGVEYINIPWSKRKLPNPESVRQYLDILESSPKPLLVHCQGGTHRTGVATAIYALENGATVDEARDAFTVFFGDAEIGEILTAYESSEKPFDQWVDEDYPAIYNSWAGTQSE